MSRKLIRDEVKEASIRNTKDQSVAPFGMTGYPSSYCIRMDNKSCLFSSHGCRGRVWFLVHAGCYICADCRRVW